MRMLRLPSALAALVFVLAASPAAALTLTFKVDITSANGGAFAPFSFVQTWTLDDALPDGGAATPDATAPTDVLKAAAAFPTSAYAGAWRLDDLVGETREPGTVTVFRLGEEADPPGPYSYAFKIASSGLDLVPGASLFDTLKLYDSTHDFDVFLTGPAPGEPGEVRVPGTMVQRQYRGVANLVTPAAAPEPGAWLLLISGFAVAGGALRARRRVAPAPATN